MPSDRKTKKWSGSHRNGCNKKNFKSVKKRQNKNQRVKEMVGIEGTITVDIEKKQLTWYRYQQ